MLGPGRIDKEAHHVPKTVVAHGSSGGGSGKVKLGKDTVLHSDTMLLTRLVHKVADNFSLVVDIVQFGAGAARYIDLREHDAPWSGLRRNVCEWRDR